LSLPDVGTVRNRITETEDEQIRHALTLMYLTCGRAKEIISRTTPGDKSGRNVASGPKGTDTRLTEFGDFEVALFNIYTQKRGGLKRIIALPTKYEPFAAPLHKYMTEFGDKPVFNFTRQKLWREGKPQFKGLIYPIDKYTIYKNGELIKTVLTHNKPFNLHALRHIRATELIEYYNFNGIELSIYGGWTLRTMGGVGSAMSRSVHLDWGKYIGKLFKKRVW
jgi:hypothetical protein